MHLTLSKLLSQRKINMSNLWTKDKCIEDALNHSTKISWKKSNGSAYNAANRNGWMPECSKHMQALTGFITLDVCKKDALKYNTRIDWKKISYSIYSVASRRKWLSLCTGHMKRLLNHKGYWTFEKCKEEALKYKTKKAWAKENPSSLFVSKKNGWFKELTQHMPKRAPTPLKWSMSECLSDASKHSTKTEWENSNPILYAAAYRNKWLEQCCKHMKNCGGSSVAEKEIFDIIKATYGDATKKRFKKMKNEKKGSLFEIDVFIPSLNKGVEYDGTYWHSTEGILRGRPNWTKKEASRYVQIKNECFDQYGIKIIRIKDFEWKKNKQECINKVMKFLGGM